MKTSNIGVGTIMKQGDVVRCNILHKRKTLRMAIFNPIVTTFYSGKPDCTIITLKIKIVT